MALTLYRTGFGDPDSFAATEVRMSRLTVFLARSTWAGFTARER
jgi:hypothetical protein